DQASLPGSILAAVVGDLSRASSDRDEADELVRRREDRFRSLLESAPDAVVIIDDRGRIVLVNEQPERLFGYRREELVGQTVEMLLPQPFRDQHLGLRRGYFAHPS